MDTEGPGVSEGSCCQRQLRGERHAEVYLLTWREGALELRGCMLQKAPQHLRLPCCPPAPPEGGAEPEGEQGAPGSPSHPVLWGPEVGELLFPTPSSGGFQGALFTGWDQDSGSFPGSCYRGGLLPSRS